MSGTSQELYRIRRLNARECIRCGKPAEPDIQSCKACRDKLNQLSRARRDGRVEQGLCERCGVAPLEDGRQCLPCREKYATWRRHFLKRTKARKAMYSKHMRSHLKKKGRS